MAWGSRDTPAFGGKLADRLATIGAPRPPAYVRTNEIGGVRAPSIVAAPRVQSARHGRGEIVLDAKVEHYLWAIDVGGGFHVAPYRRRADGAENIGHPMLLGGRPARLAGELRLVRVRGKRVRWVLDNDSGRYVNPYGRTRRKQLKAARALLRAIGVRDSRGRTLAIAVEVVPPLDRRDLARIKRKAPERAQAVKRARRGRAYWPIPQKGASAKVIPAELRDDEARARWALRASRSLGKMPTGAA